jgi:hypothetical protein
VRLLMAGVDKLTVPYTMRFCNSELRIGTGKTNSTATARMPVTRKKINSVVFTTTSCPSPKCWPPRMPLKSATFKKMKVRQR